jgi:energy-coupling factor transporter ATP-binding protein EcfA2
LTTQHHITADLNQVRQWLATLHGGSPGLISIFETDTNRHGVFPTDATGLDNATTYVGSLDRQGRKGIYARCTTLSERPASGRGLAHLSHVFPGFWADIDIDGPGHKHEICQPDCTKKHSKHITNPLPPDVDAAKKVIHEAGLPEPTLLIHSGGGLYPWWMLHEPHLITDDLADMAMLSARWQHALLAGAERLGYHYGTGVGDLSRILRIPGTVNRKAGLERPCRIIESSGLTYSLDELGVLLFTIDLPEAAPAQSGGAAPDQDKNLIPRRPGSVGPYDALGEVCEWRDLLEPAGFYYRRTEADGAQLWKYSGSSAESEYSVRAWPHVLVNHSESTPLPVGSGNRLTHGKVFGHLHHGGNHQAAAKDLIYAATGNPAASPAAAALPAHVLDHIRQRAGLTMWTPARPHAAPPPFLTPHPADTAEREENADGEAEPGDWESGPTRRRGLLPEDFWAARPSLRHIRQAAHARARSGDIVLAGALARLASMLPPALRAETGVGAPASLNMFVVLLGPSGSGKSSAAWIPRQLLPAPYDLDFLDELPLGTGEGVAEAYMGEREQATGEKFQSGPRAGQNKTALVRMQVRHNALFYADEGESLTKQLFGRNGATVGETIRRAWTGGTIGQFNGHKVNTRVIESGTYSLGLVVGFQPETALPLVEDAAAGTPQRFLWASSTDPAIPEDIVEDPGPLPLNLIRLGFGDRPQLSFARSILTEIRADDRARATGAVRLPPLDSHKPLMLVKLASLLAILDDRLNVTEEDWQLAGLVWETSAELRDALIEYGTRQLAADAEKRVKAHVAQEVRAHAAKAAADRDIERVARRAAKRVHEAEGMTRGALNKDTASRDRGWLGAAVDYAEARGWITTEGDEIAPGDSVPS